MIDPNHVNGSAPHVPLDLTPAQRNAKVRECGLYPGWLLLTMAEMLEMRRQMTECENELNKEQKRRKNAEAEVKKLRAQLVNKTVASVKEAGKAEEDKLTLEKLKKAKDLLDKADELRGEPSQ